MSESRRIKALKLMLEEMNYPNRDLRLSSQVMDCKAEMYAICEWLKREIEREIDIETMFDEVGETEPPAP
jgi:hypothetical protein